MKNFFRNHPDVLLVVLATVFSLFVVGYFVWGMGDVIAALNIALKNPPEQPAAGFDLKDAATLNLHGLGQ